MSTARSAQRRPAETVPTTADAGLTITVRTGSGSGRTLLSAFDHALHLAGVADFNLVTLSSVIPPGSRVRNVDAPLAGGHGDVLFAVRAEAFAERPGDVAWAGLGWCADETGAGLFVEHHGTSEEQVATLIETSLADMQATRDHDYGPVSMTLASAVCVDRPVCALVIAAYEVATWRDAAPAAAPVREEEQVSDAGHGRVGPRSVHGHSVTSAEPSEPPLHDDEVVSSRSVPVPEASRSAVARVTVETHVDAETARDYYRLYRQSFSGIETLAVARHMLHESEFLEEMLDPRVHKYIAWGHGGEAVGMTTLTQDLATVPWISPQWFAHHLPEHSARQAAYYFGFALVHPDHQGAQVLRAMIEPMALEVMRNRGVVTWDMCAANDARGFGQTYMKLLEAFGDVTTEVIDRQTYYAATYHGPRTDDPAAAPHEEGSS
ncbi:pyruvoyl-dependent arginine decarboxylase [Nocardioides lijunqiniae]|uniref:pyruvoyl-dependent arginine decarboxylase n=1 Tax=Nocardioides lijunqiniae TaxID=2760832 RepID=UPI001878C82D|nr:pyruvoyl-dependent arginine decarboxylase [Nocardioides lijunqiniae]